MRSLRKPSCPYFTTHSACWLTDPHLTATPLPALGPSLLVCLPLGPYCCPLLCACSRAAMEADIAAGQFLEHQHVHGNIYGTSLMAAAQVAMEGKVRGWGGCCQWLGCCCGHGGQGEGVGVGCPSLGCCCGHGGQGEGVGGAASGWDAVVELVLVCDVVGCHPEMMVWGGTPSHVTSYA